MHLCIASDTITTLYISIYVQVIWHQLLNRQSSTEKGTLLAATEPVKQKCCFQWSLHQRESCWRLPVCNCPCLSCCCWGSHPKLSSRSRVQELAKAVVDCFVSLDLFTGPSWTTARTDGEYAFWLLAWSGGAFMTPSGKGMVSAWSPTGDSCLCYSKLEDAQTTAVKQRRCWWGVPISRHHDSQHSCSGPGLLTPTGAMTATYQWIFI